MGSLLSSPVTDVNLLDNLDEDGSRSPIASKSYNGAQPSGTESAQREETEPTMRGLTTPYMPNVLTTPTNVSSQILAAGPSTTPTAYSTALQSTQDDNTRQPTSQMNEPDVTPSLFSPIAMEPTIQYLRHRLSMKHQWIERRFLPSRISGRRTAVRRKERIWKKALLTNDVTVFRAD